MVEESAEQSSQAGRRTVTGVTQVRDESAQLGSTRLQCPCLNSSAERRRSRDGAFSNEQLHFRQWLSLKIHQNFPLAVKGLDRCDFLALYSSEGNLMTSLEKSGIITLLLQYHNRARSLFNEIF